MARNESSSNSNTLYLQPFAGRIAAKSKEPREGFQLKTYTNISTGATMSAYVKTYQSISGKIRKVQYREGENEGQKIQSWKILLQDSDGLISFEFGAATNVARTWLRTTPNIDISKDIELVCFPDKKNEKKTVLVIKQDGTALKFAYTKDNPNGMPSPKLRATGKWDFGDTEEWLHERNLEFCDKVSKNNQDFGQEQENEYHPTNEPQIQETPKSDTFTASSVSDSPISVISAGQKYRDREGTVLTIVTTTLDEIEFQSTKVSGLHKISVESWSKSIAPKYTLQENDDNGDLPF